MSFENPDDQALRRLFEETRTVAVVGLSPKASRPSHGVARALQRFGYRIIPVRPAIGEVLGEPAYATLEEVPKPIDLVDVFRAPEYVDAIVDSCIALRIPAIWLQEGVVNEAAAARARAAGITVVMDRCTYKDYVRIFAGASHKDK
ncbi:MAG: CoA-binding protein [Acidithiobacillales bacterium SG8_45]|jgi:predicted CoA-binding protein|nr:MAG: CoA-binding protein [Acidithiobacillales bacterium SG8_45]